MRPKPLTAVEVTDLVRVAGRLEIQLRRLAAAFRHPREWWRTTVDPVPAAVDRADLWARTRLGSVYGALPGKVVLDRDGGPLRVHLKKKLATLRAFQREAERHVRKLVVECPGGALARAVAALNASRQRTRWLRTELRAQARASAALPRTLPAARNRRAERRGRRSAHTRRTPARSKDPPEPPIRPSRAPSVGLLPTVTRHCAASSGPEGLR